MLDLVLSLRGLIAFEHLETDLRRASRHRVLLLQEIGRHPYAAAFPEHAPIPGVWDEVGIPLPALRPTGILAVAVC